VRVNARLCRDAQAASGTAHATFEHVSRSQITPDLWHGHRLVAVRQRRRSGEHAQLSDLGELGDDIFRHTIAEIFFFLRATQVFKVQHDHRFFRSQDRRHHPTQCFQNLAHRSDALRCGFGQAPLD
jgi:hypothetical protein